jgi:hypothetical protein
MVVLSTLDLLGACCGMFVLGYVCCFLGMAVSESD